MTKEQSNILKGIGIIMMLFLHLFNTGTLNQVCEPLFYIGDIPLVHIMSRACNPVGIFLIISGYGIGYAYSNKGISFESRIKKVIKLYIHYWIILFVFVCIGSYFNPDKYPGSIIELLLNIISVRSSYNSEMWFLFPYTLVYLSSNLIFKFINKLGAVYSFCLSYVVYIVCCYIISRYIAPAKAYTEWYAYILTYFNVSFPFIIGILFYKQKNQLERVSTLINKHCMIAPISFLFFFVLNCIVSNAAIGPIFSFVYIYLLLHFNMKGIIRETLVKLGNISMVMWMTHSYFCYHIFHDFIYSFRYPLVIFIVLLTITVIVSIPLMSISKKVINAIAYLR